MVISSAKNKYPKNKHHKGKNIHIKRNEIQSGKQQQCVYQVTRRYGKTMDHVAKFF